MSSVLSKMAKTINQDKNVNIDTEEYLSQIYDSLLKEIKKKSLNREEKKALQIQTFLRQIKYIQQNNLASDDSLNLSQSSSNFPFSRFWNKKFQIQLMEDLYAAHKEMFTERLLTLTSNKSQVLGKYLEDGMQQVLDTLESAVTQVKYEDIEQKSIHIVGGKHVQAPDLIKTTDIIMKSEFNTVYVETQKELKKYTKGKNKISTFMPSVQGKIDINGYTADLIAESKVDLSKYTQDILKALKDATFTAKNYTSTYELKFGQSNPFRIFATVAPNGHETVGRFCRMISCFEFHTNQHSNAPILFYRIKAIYELTGFGTKYVDSALNQAIGGKGAKYLVWNSPLGEIYVIPTQKIVNELIQNAAEESLPDGWKDALYGPVKLLQTDISKLAK